MDSPQPERSRANVLPESWAVVSSFALIFAFSSVDHSISPLVDLLHRHYAVPLEKVLWLISSCTLGIIIGVFAGPAFTASFRSPRIATASTAVLALSLVLFLVTRDFTAALVLRFVFGLAAGLLSTTMWWLAYQGVTKRHFQPMITVLMAARPLAVALGVPLAGLVSLHWGWTGAFSFFLLLLAAGGVALFFSSPRDEGAKSPLSPRNLVGEYVIAFRFPYAPTFYFGLFVNKICYFGFYSLAGIWLLKNFSLTTVGITSILMYIGMAEALVNFVIPAILKRLGHRAVFTWSLVVSAVVFALFMGGRLPLSLSVVLFALFAVLDRIYSMAIVVSLPVMFENLQNKTVMGSLLTLSSWTSLTFVSWLEGKYLSVTGLWPMVLFLLGSFIVGSAIIWYVQYRAVFQKEQAAEKIERAAERKGAQP